MAATNEVMIDFETLDTTASAVLISLGAVKFNLTTGEVDEQGFYTVIDIQSNIDAGRTISESTLCWWLKQSPEAQQVFHEPNKMLLESALTEFTAWLGHSEYRMWGNGPTFDLGKLAHAYNSFGMPYPWQYWNERCVRTYRDLPGAKAVPKVTPKIAHHGLFDAIAQAQHLIQIHQAVFGPSARKGKK